MRLLWCESFYYHCAGLDNTPSSKVKYIRLGTVATRTISCSYADSQHSGEKNPPYILRDTQIGISLTQFLGMSCSKTALPPPVRVRWVKLCLTSGTVN